jgi:Domain of unknown function DUF29
MEEILELRRSVEEGRYNDALTLIGEMEEMAKEDKINKIGSYIVILLIHLIKQHAERHTTRSWTISVENAIDAIHETNGRRKANGMYMNQEQFREAIDQKFQSALKRASLEAFGGAYTAKHLATLLNADAVKAQALEYILNGYPESED